MEEIVACSVTAELEPTAALPVPDPLEVKYANAAAAVTSATTQPITAEARFLLIQLISSPLLFVRIGGSDRQRGGIGATRGRLEGCNGRQDFSPLSNLYKGISSRFDRSRRLSMRMAADLAWTIYESPLGTLTVVAGPAGIRNVYFPGRLPRLHQTARRTMGELVDQLDAYFAGERQAFELDLDLRGAPLQMAVWAQLREIPYGKTTTYGELAGLVDDSLYPQGLEPYKRVRCAAAAIGRTPTPILIPCHRVIGADGSLTGYGGGLQRKQALLDLENGEVSMCL